MKKTILRILTVAVLTTGITTGSMVFDGGVAKAAPPSRTQNEVQFSEQVKISESDNAPSCISSSCKRFNIYKVRPHKQAWYLMSHRHRRSEYGCLYKIIMRESGWNVFANNPYSGAYGIPQALPGEKMAGWMFRINRDGKKVGKWYIGKRWWNQSYVQLFWMIRKYIPDVYGTACNAWQHEINYGWY